MDNLVLDIKGITKSFGPLSILNGVNLSIRPNETVAILGPSGAGKSTLLHLAGLMEKPDTGTIRIQGQETANMSDFELAACRLNSVGFLFQFHYLLPDFNVLENVCIPVRLAKDDFKEKENEARALLDELGMSHRLHHRPSQLSGGEQQRAALARALIRKPNLILCDEPTGNLDQESGEQVWRLILNQISKNNLAAVIVTHNQDLAKHSKRIFKLDKGLLS